MHRKELWIPFAVVGLTVAFALVSLLVRWSRGNPWLVRRKLRLGALLLGLTWSTAGCDSEQVTCYAPLPPDPPTNYIEFDDPFVHPEGLVVDLSFGHALTGSVLRRRAGQYAYRLRDGQTEVQRGELTADDGAFDDPDEPFALDLGAEIAPAVYELMVFADGIDDGEVILEAPLTVVPGR